MYSMYMFIGKEGCKNPEKIGMVEYNSEDGKINKMKYRHMGG